MLKTHYDNLQVVRNASPEVIKGAYRYLSQKWHPDKNPDNCAEAERVLKIINRAYEVLSDPRLRKEHDDWIVEQEAAESETTSASTEPSLDDTNPTGEWTGPARGEWVKYYDSGRALYYYDPTTITKSGHLRRVWFIADLKQRLDGALSYLDHYEYGCKEKRYRELSVTKHSGQMASGGILQSWNTAGEWERIPLIGQPAIMLKILLAQQEAAEARPAAEREQARSAAHETPLDNVAPEVLGTVVKWSLGALKNTISAGLWLAFPVVAFASASALSSSLKLGVFWSLCLFVGAVVAPWKMGEAVTHGDSGAWLMAPVYAMGFAILPSIVYL